MRKLGPVMEYTLEAAREAATNLAAAQAAATAGTVDGAIDLALAQDRRNEIVRAFHVLLHNVIDLTDRPAAVTEPAWRTP